MTPFEALVIGIVEGITEFLPVSSTGHMILVSDLLNLNTKSVAVETFEVFIQLGAILAVVYLYLNRFKDLISLNLTNNESPKGFKGFRGLQLLAIACLPAFFLGAIFHSKIKAYLFSSINVALALIVGGIAMIIIERRQKKLKSTILTDKLDNLTFKQAFMVGCFQCFALWPGMSRSASTIIGGLIAGLSRTVAAEFSFLVAVPVMCAAVTLDLYKSLPYLTNNDIVPFLVGFVTSFIVALIAIKWFISFLSKTTMEPFAIYRIIIGIIVLLYYYL
jgi:undecaprenyl-diphosphatase